MTDEYEMEYTREDELLEQIERLEKENAELKEKVKHAEENCINKTCVVFKDKEDCVAKLLDFEKENIELKKRLTEVKLDSLQNFNRSLRAKEIIKLLLSDLGNRSYEPVKDIERAEQFLKEGE